MVFQETKNLSQFDYISFRYCEKAIELALACWYTVKESGGKRNGIGVGMAYCGKQNGIDFGIAKTNSIIGGPKTLFFP